MKNLLLPLLLLLFVSCTASGQDTLTIQTDTSADNSNLSRIRLQALPEEIRQKLAGADYSGWQLQAAYKARADNHWATAATDYVVVLKKGDETIRVRFDDAGNRSEEEEERE